MRINPFIAIPAAYFLYRGLSKGYGASRLNFYMIKLVPRFEGFTPVLDIHIGVQNPSGESFTVNSIVGNLYANQSLIGNLSSFSITQIQPNAQTALVVSVRLSIGGIAAELWNAIQGGVTSISQKLRIQGTVNVSGVPVPLDLSYTVI